MTTSTPEVLMHHEINCTTQEETIRPYTPEELKQRDLDIAASVQRQADEAAAQADHEAALAKVNAKLKLVGLTPEDLVVLGKEFKTL